MSWIINGSNNDLSPVQQQAISLTNDESLSTGPPEALFSEIPLKMTSFNQENAFENVIYKMLT